MRFDLRKIIEHENKRRHRSQLAAWPARSGRLATEQQLEDTPCCGRLDLLAIARPEDSSSALLLQPDRMS